MVTTTTAPLTDLYRARKDRVDILDVPELGYLAVDGRGAPDRDPTDFQAALHVLMKVSYTAHFLAKERSVETPRVMPLEALWWVAGSRPDAFEDAEPSAWRWRALVMQPDPIDEELLAEAMRRCQQRGISDLHRLEYLRWEEGRCAQTMHIGPYDAEGPTIARLHREVAAAGYRPTGRHHEIYLGDPRRAAPEKLRTILRTRIERIAA